MQSNFAPYKIKEYTILIVLNLLHRSTVEIIKKLVKKKFLAKNKLIARALVDESIIEFSQDAKYKGFELLNHEILGIIEVNPLGQSG